VNAEYVFRATFRLEPADPEVSVDPERFDTVLRKRAADPGEDGWLFFRDNLWRGEVGDAAYLREQVEELLVGRSSRGERESGRGIVVERVSFSELVTDGAYLSALREAIGADLEAFRADDVDEVLHKYLGSSVRIEERE
jgi:hypothetical protein